MVNFFFSQLLPTWSWRHSAEDPEPRLQCGPQNLNTEGMHVVKNRKHTYLGIDYDTIFPSKYNYGGILGSFFLKG